LLGIALGLGASLCWGVSDFVGGLQSRRSPQIGVMLAGAVMGLLLLAVVIGLTGREPPAPRFLLAGVAGGTAITVALFAFYRGLAIGVMSVVAPIAAAGVVLPVLVGIASGDRPGPIGLLGAGVAIVGVVLVSRQEDDGDRAVPSSMGLSVVLAIVAAVGFGCEFIALHEAAKGDPLWGAAATVATYSVLLAIVAAVSIARGASITPQRSALPWLVALGLFFGGANACYAQGTREGQLSAVAVSASLYPAVTVLLARHLLGERVRRVQEVGIVVALAGITMLAAS
jgi:drug/metabolite transporter (DMT)-like permease